MASSKAAPWVLGTAFVGILILGVAWMLAISPQMELVSTARADAEAARSQNVVLTQRLGVLGGQAADLDTYKADLAAIRVQIPAEDGLAPLLREFAATAAASSVFIVSIMPGEPVPFVSAVPPEVVPAAEPAVDVAAAQGQASGTGDTVAPAAPVPSGPQGLVAVPIEITVLGTYDNTVTFMALVQEQLQRLFLVTDFTTTEQKASPPSGGRPATVFGDAEFRIKGFVYVQQPVAAVAETPADVTTQ